MGLKIPRWGGGRMPREQKKGGAGKE